MRLLKNWHVSRSPFHRAFPSASAQVAAQVDKRIAVDMERRFIYFRIPKAANSTVASTLAPSAHADSESSRSAKRYFLRASELSNDDVANLTSRYFLFTVVRDPFSRIASAYLHKILNTRSPGKLKVAKYYRRNPQDHISFIEFCRYLGDQGTHADPHWYRQVDLIPCGTEKIHFIGRVESLSDDLASIISLINGDSQVKIRNQVSHRTGASSRLAELYCEETVETVRRLYAADFSAFGYDTYPEWIEA